MSKFKYVGDTRFKEVDGEKVDMAPPPVTTVFGIDFELDGEAKEVPEQFVNKFRGNQTFVEVFDEPETKATTPTRLGEYESAVPLAEAYKTLSGEEPDKRWGEKRLRQELEKLSGN